MGDFRGIPTPICPACGGDLIQITASFDPLSYELNMYLLDNATCANCGALLTAPTPADYKIA
jgi:rRNA maturation protein Nop10